MKRIRVSIWEDYYPPKGTMFITAATLGEARTHIQKVEGDIVLLDLQLPDGYGPNLLIEMSNIPNRPPVIMITGYGDIESAVDAMKNGAMDFLTKPVDFPQLEKSIKRAADYVAMRNELEHLRRTQMQNAEFVIGSSQVMKEAVELAGKAALKKANVLIIGETGTGKDVLAQYIYSNGHCRPNSYVPINCAAIQNTMLESELFGHEAGAFTTAMKRKQGLMDMADGGRFVPG
jgi:DNA-binding NtrC family response regulator